MSSNKKKRKEQDPVEFTLSTLLIGAVVGIIMTASNVYLGLYAGMTVSASIPAAVIAAGIFKLFPTRDALYKSNIVQTIASAGESLAAGIIFTVPALVLVGAWKDFAFWPTTIIAISGGLLGVIFMIPLRKALISGENKELTYPEGVACAKVLQNTNASHREGSQEGFKNIILGLIAGGVFKMCTSGLGLFVASFERATALGSRVFVFGSDMSPALLAVGYIIRLRVAALVFLGGALGWFIGIPFLSFYEETSSLPPLGLAWSLWDSKIRYLGVGAMLVGGVSSILNVRKGLTEGLKEIKNSYAHTGIIKQRKDQDMSLSSMSFILVIITFAMFCLYYSFLGNFGLSFSTTALMLVCAFPFVAVASYIAGLVGSSNSPTSGITIAVLLLVAAFFLALGYHGDSAILATLGIASIVCCAAATSGDCSQDLKTGFIIGATPKYQQWAECLGVVIPAFTLAPVLTLLHNAYGIGDGLKAPQATLFASLTQGIFGKGSLPKDMLLYGIVFGLVVLTLDKILARKNSNLRLPLMPIAVGIYLPLGLSFPLFLGGLIQSFASQGKKEESDDGVLLSSGLIAGEALIGVLIAVFISMGISLNIISVSHFVQELLSLVAFVGIAICLYKKS